MFDVMLQAYTKATTAFVQPASGSTVVVNVDSSAWMPIGLPVFCENGGAYAVVARPTETSVTLRNSGAIGNAAPGSSIKAGSLIAPGGGGATAASQVVNDSAHAPGVHVSDALDAIIAAIPGAPIKFSFLNLTDNFSATNIGTLPAGFYNIVIELYLHTAGTAGGITAALEWTDRMGFGHAVSTVQDRGSIALVVANAYSLPISVDGTHNVTHQVTGITTPGALLYDLHYTFTPQS